MAVMNSPDQGVASTWQPGASAPGPVKNPILLAVNGTSSASTSVSLGGVSVSTVGSFDITATVTEVDAQGGRVSLNGFWINKSFVDRIAGMNIAGLKNLQAEFGNLGAGDRVRVKGTAMNGVVSVSSFEVIHVAAVRSELQNRLQALIEQLRALLARQNGSSTATSTGQ
jgi:hypothetical protein